MSKVQLTFTRFKSTFGTTVRLAAKDKATYDMVLLENADFDPLKGQTKKLDKGYMFRSPNISEQDLKETLQTFANIEGKFNLSAKYDKDKKSITALIKFADQSDAALFGWSNVEVWQKWSAELEAEAELESKKKPPKIKVDKNGRVTVKVTVSTLGDIQ